MIRRRLRAGSSTHPVRDAVVVGAGHNGLIAAAYLAQAGRSVQVLERDTVAGGAVSTVERFPGYRVDRGSSAHLMIRHSPVLDELQLSAHGLRYVDCDPWAFAPGTATTAPIVFRTDLEATCASIAAAVGTADAEAYRQFVGVWRPRARAVMRSFYSPAAPGRFATAFAGLTGTAESARPGPIARRAGAMLSLTQELMSSGDALLDRWFTAEPLKAALAWFGAQSGPPMNAPGTAPMIGFAALQHDIPPGRALGGSGALTEALLRRISADGGEVATGRPAVAISRCGDHWRVDTPVDGGHCATTVIAACHVLTTLDLLATGGYDPKTIDRWRAQIAVGDGIGMAVRMGTDQLPVYPDLPSDLPAHGVHSALALLVTDRAHLRRAQTAASVGELPERPALVAMGYSAIDPSLAPPGEHLLNVWAQWHPRRLADGTTWQQVAPAAAAAVTAELDRHAPGFSDHIRHTHIQTPEDLENELG
ncbi:MAG: NAD(P)/FAD-dependent oxidoreductase, partial [Actinomycetota bacterium]|nr:NAD(P)/FAD-dependent oxidoreductase [Actinomycetota bacterium]